MKIQTWGFFPHGDRDEGKYLPTMTLGIGIGMGIMPPSCGYIRPEGISNYL